MTLLPNSPTINSQPMIDVRPSASRAGTRLAWLDSRHSFNFGRHFDTSNRPHGLLIVSNDDTVAPGAGFNTHHHADMEIITWVLSGALEHRDSTGHSGIIRHGLVQRMSAGTGIDHSERNHSDTDPVHFVQMWVAPDRYDADPGYQQFDITDRLSAGGLVLAASGRDPDAPVTLNQNAASMWIGRLREREAIVLPQAAFVHLYVATGSISFDSGHSLDAGDAARLTHAIVTITATQPSEIIVWGSDDAIVQ